MGSSSVCKKF